MSPLSIESKCSRFKMSKVIVSENLVTNRRHREKWGAKVDSVQEALDVIQNGIKGMGDSDDAGALVGPFEDDLTKVGDDCRHPDKEVNSDTMQITAKLFMRKNDRQMAMEAVNKVKQLLKTDRIHNLYVTVPAEYEDKIGMTDHSESDAVGEEDEDTKEMDPEREGYALEFAKLWNDLTSVDGVEALGVCDVETDVCKRIYQEAHIKPKNIQVNLKTCCMVPPELKAFATAEGIKLLTHSDSPEILAEAFCHQVTEMAEKDNWQPSWIIRFQIFRELRGLLEDRRYVVALQK